ncbi:hypothetical protein CRE_18627 [Caenorhabditis remanei]|uniref:Glycosyltransferase family 92 protein n=1 Tax=Caenorhabditis remanei TaxID=31234 RepID=E3LKE4_CAERE|nr:hypothetical protein CRE_18627 [Caenorhabditis remanei]
MKKRWLIIVVSNIILMLLVFYKTIFSESSPEEYFVKHSEITVDFSDEAESTYPVTPFVYPLFSYTIDGMDRFEWYKRQMYLNMNIHKAKIASNISTLYAYEFEHEITITTTSRDRMGYRVYCRYIDENDMEIGEPFESFTYPEYIVACKKRKGTRKIGLSVEKNGEFQPLPIVNRMLNKPTYELSMCIATLYGDEPKWLMFIEMIEHYKLQGVQHFYLHIHNASNYDLKVINEYVRTGELEVHYLLERDRRADNHWHMVNVADCLVWSRLESRWTIFADLDERISMTNYNGTIRNFVRNVRDESIGSLQFRQQWIIKHEFMPVTFEGDEKIIEWMPTHRWHNSSGIGSPGHTTKCIIDSSKVFNMFIHNVIQFFPKQNGSYVEVGVKPEQGVIRHYRDQSLGNWGEKWLKGILKFGQLRNTYYSKKLIGKLTENVKRRAKYVYDNVD